MVLFYADVKCVALRPATFPFPISSRLGNVRREECHSVSLQPRSH